MPGERLEYYMTHDITKMRSKIFEKTNEITNSLGFYPVVAQN